MMVGKTNKEPSPEAAPSSDLEDEAAPLIDVLAEWSGSSSIHGIPHAFNRADYKCGRRIVWVLLVLASFGIMIWQLTDLIQGYRKYEVQTNSILDYPKDLAFPEVTVCNANMIDSYYVNETGISEPFNEEELALLSQNREEFILGTWFKEIEQDDDKVWKAVITHFGRCWTFQPDKVEFTNDKIYRPGIYGGLDVYFDIEQDYYADDTMSAGLRVFVTQRGSTINDQMHSVFVPPGTMSFVGVQRSTFQREEELPWSYCHGAAPAYTQQKCRAQCYDAAYRGVCGCRNIGDNAAKELDYCVAEDWEVCNEEIPNDEDILVGCSEIEGECPGWLKQIHDQGLCDCALPPCHEEVYALTTSSLDVSEAFKLTLFEAFGWGEDPSYFEMNFVGLRVNFEQILETKLTESKAQTFSQLLAGIGGTMGLFAGISVLSLLEIFDLFSLRLIPRLFGYRGLHGLGTKKSKQSDNIQVVRIEF